MRVDGRFNNSADVTGSGDLNVGTLLANNGTVFGCTLPDDECCAEPYCSTTGGGPLPIELLYFRSELALQAVNLQWRTAAEIGNDYFTIERSKDGSNFETLGTIDGAGNSTWQIDYSFSDSKPLSGTSYYRLKQTDYDGQYEYSEVIASNYGLATQYQNFKIYPNPTTSREFNVLFDFKASSVGITLFDIAGIAIKEYTYSNIEVNSRERIVLDSEVPSGVYVLQVHSGDMVQYKKLIVKN